MPLTSLSHSLLLLNTCFLFSSFELSHGSPDSPSVTDHSCVWTCLFSQSTDVTTTEAVVSAGSVSLVGEPPSLPPLTMAAKAESVASVTSQCSFSSTIVHVGDKKPPESGGNQQHPHSLNPASCAAGLQFHVKACSMTKTGVDAYAHFFLSSSCVTLVACIPPCIGKENDHRVFVVMSKKITGAILQKPVSLRLKLQLILASILLFILYTFVCQIPPFFINLLTSNIMQLLPAVASCEIVASYLKYRRAQSRQNISCR